MFDKNSLTQEQKEEIIKQVLAMDESIPDKGPCFDKNIKTKEGLSLKKLKRKYKSGKVSEDDLLEFHFYDKKLSSSDYFNIKWVTRAKNAAEKEIHNHYGYTIETDKNGYIYSKPIIW